MVPRLPSLGLLLKLHDSISEVICIIDEEGHFVYLNQASYKVWGYQPEEMIGQKCFHLIVKEDQKASMDIIAAAQDGNEINTFENRYYRKDGSIAFMYWEGCWSPADRVLYCTGRDITTQRRLEQVEKAYQDELRRAKERLERLLDRITDGFAGMDEEGRIFYWNKAAEALSQIPRKEILGKTLWDVVPEPMKSIYWQRYIEIKAKNGPVSSELYSQRIKRWIELNAYVSGSGLSIYFRDITDKRRLQEQLQHEKDLQQKRITAAVIKAAEEERSQVGKELHDNVNQVLTTVKLYTELCLTDPTKCESILKKAAVLLQESINEIRGLSKRLSAPSLGGIRLRDSIGELVDAINATNRLLICYENDVEELELSDEIHVAVYRILQEQFTNIIKHANATTASVKITIENQELLVTVYDNGQGFDTTKVRKGVGIENMASRAQGLNGSLDIVSEAGKGCTLFLKIPLEEED
jgi:PAS domain S-box-containing protein